ncbi:BTAD domain-containing putative transcriptional regulator [uncultured Phycicoccus sp.]|uniref:AfsR/SARP family transcriptional regulator n=1 Tax=uncultured Phycicoccus sp. TaxID=661422 RepID=UPI0026235D33|nr:BTAD domain-containing putative transcriptional regulator [uncultured Phycicoccus sp.]
MSSPRVRRQVRVLGRLAVVPDDHLPAAARRAIAYLAVKGPVAQRSLMSMELWPTVLDERARANLRRAIWQTPPGWLTATSWEVTLEADVDLAEARQVADLALDCRPLDASQIDLLTRDLLPGWYEEWLEDERDTFHLARLQGLEAVCRTATGLRQFGLATRAGLAAVTAEPLRQSAVLALVRAHLEEGNSYEALRRVEHYRDLLRTELGVDPAPEVVGLVADVAHPSSTG